LEQADAARQLIAAPFISAHKADAPIWPLRRIAGLKRDQEGRLDITEKAELAKT
jgi:hypothetical protein